MGLCIHIGQRPVVNDRPVIDTAAVKSSSPISCTDRVGCVPGAPEENEYRTKLAAAGFEQVDVEPARIYRAEDPCDFLSGQGIDVEALAPQVDGKFMSAFVRAVKPNSAKPCCGPTCCN